MPACIIILIQFNSFILTKKRNNFNFYHLIFLVIINLIKINKKEKLNNE